MLFIVQLLTKILILHGHNDCDHIHSNMWHVEQHVALAAQQKHLRKEKKRANSTKGVPYDVYCELSLLLLFYYFQMGLIRGLYY